MRSGFAKMGWISGSSASVATEVEEKEYGFAPIVEYCKTGEGAPLLEAIEEVKNGEATERREIALELNAALRDEDWPAAPAGILTRAWLPAIIVIGSHT